jgi:glutathione S-transferase
MSLILHSHPLSSFCQKVIVALYENETPFTAKMLDLSDPEERAAFLRLWPTGKIPLLEDTARGQIIPETSIMIEYIARHYPGRATLIPADPDAALEMRLQDRLFDLYVELPMQKIVADRMRAPGEKDPAGVAQARAQLQVSYDIIAARLEGRTWLMGDIFTMADCGAAPALYYANMVEPFGASHPTVAAYLARLQARPSYARAFKESEPFLQFVPKADA